MSEARLLNVLMSPHITEKSSMVTGQYAFKVAMDATKPEVKAAVEKQFNVTVAAVRICRVKGKTTRFRQVRGRRSNWKKAYVMLAPGSEIDLGHAG